MLKLHLRPFQVAKARVPMLPQCLGGRQQQEAVPSVSTGASSISLKCADQRLYDQNNK